MGVLMALDVGNTNIVIGLYSDDTLVRSFRIFTDRRRTADEYSVKLKSLIRHEGFTTADLDDIAISSVVPAMLSMLEELSVKLLGKKALFVSASLDLGITIDIDHPSELGADMIASAVAAYESYGGPSIVLDFGTATTIAALTQDGRFIGASIAPGLETSCDAIYRRAPHLTRIKLLPPPSVIGRNTVHSMQSGILLGHACLVDGMVERFREAMGGSARVIATGGLAEAVKEQSMCIEVVRPDLILEGIRIIHLRNRR